MTEVEKILTAARDLIADRGRWIQRALWMSANGDSGCKVEDAVCFCALGAMLKALNDSGHSITKDPVRQRVRDYLNKGVAKAGAEQTVLPIVIGITQLNDLVGHQSVMRAYNHAINLAKGEEH